MEIIALGTGSAFCMMNWQSNYAIRKNGKVLLVDCGLDIRFSLREAGIDLMDVDGLYVSHGHSDHVGGVETIAYCTYFNPAKAKPKFFAEAMLLYDLWDYTLRGGLQGLEGIDASLNTYFDAHPVGQNEKFEWEGIKFDIVQAVHISAKYRLVPSYGLMFTDPDNGKRIYLTTDVQFAPETSMKAYYKEADLIVHDCETAPYKSGVHAHYDQLATLSTEIKSKILLTHYQDNVFMGNATSERLADVRLNHIKPEWLERAKADGFKGFAVPGPIYVTG